MSDLASASASEEQAHAVPLSVYLAVFFTLLILTATTVWVSYLNLGQVALYVAMIVAFIKAALVVGFFMHLHYERGFLGFVFIGSLFFLLVFFVLTFMDVQTRGEVLAIQDNFALKREAAIEKRLENKQGKKAQQRQPASEDAAKQQETVH